VKDASLISAVYNSTTSEMSLTTHILWCHERRRRDKPCQSNCLLRPPCARTHASSLFRH